MEGERDRRPRIVIIIVRETEEINDLSAKFVFQFQCVYVNVYQDSLWE